jgi:hypothetical protein
MKRGFSTLALLAISSLSTIHISPESGNLAILVLPGLLFGIAVSMPPVVGDFSSRWPQLAMALFYVPVYLATAILTFFFELMNSREPTWIPFLIIALVGGAGTAMAFNEQFEFIKKLKSLVIIMLLSMAALIINVSLYPDATERYEHLGKMIALWQMVVGSGLAFSKTKADSEMPANLDVY